MLLLPFSSAWHISPIFFLSRIPSPSGTEDVVRVYAEASTQVKRDHQVSNMGDRAYGTDDFLMALYNSFLPIGGHGRAS